MALQKLPKIDFNVVGNGSLLPFFAALFRFPASNRALAPTGSGVYLICAEPDTVLYIGLTGNLRHRLSAYKYMLRGVPDAFVAWLPCDARTEHIFERMLLRKVRPPLNSTHYTGARSDLWESGINHGSSAALVKAARRYLQG